MEKKRKPIDTGGIHPVLTKLFRIMKLSSFLVILTITHVIATESYSQVTRLSIDLKNVAVKDVLLEIEDNSEFYFIYSNKLIDVNRRVDVHFNNKKVDEILDEIFEGQNVKYSINNRQIILSPKGLILSGSVDVSQQVRNVRGTVTDNAGHPLPGVTVVEKGTTQGTITNDKGKYSIFNISESATLQFSFVGMKTQEISVSGKTQINVTMAEDAIGIEEVVAVGYGVQKKVNLTGSVSAISSKEIEKLPVTQTSQLLNGLTSGVTTIQNSGQPGEDNVTIRVRGLGTFSDAGNTPLVLVDGLSSSLDNVNINDIESISILKDAASAAIYGTRAANGVILIETKKGKEGEVKVSYDANFGLQRPSEIPQIVDSWVYAEMYNEALTNDGGSPSYSDSEIALFKSGEDPDNYANKRHYDDLVASGSGFQSDHHVSFTCGTAKNSYMFSVGYLDQDGIIDETNYNRYNLALNVSSKLKENLTLNLKLNGKKSKSNEPTAVDANPAEGIEGLVNYAIKIPNTIPGKMSNGYYGNQTGYTIEGWMDSESFISNDNLSALFSASVDWNITKALKLTGLAGYDYSINKYKKFLPVLEVDETITAEPSELTVKNTTNSLLTLQAYLNYDWFVNKHTFHFLAGYSQESNEYNYLWGYRDDFPNNELYELDAGAASNQQNSGYTTEWALRSFFGRFNYNFDEKYLFEANVRYDGSSRFPKDNRYGLFPSLSSAWRVSEEDFFKVSWIDNLKIRASWGKLGNQNIGNYPYQQVIALGLDAPFGVSEELSSGAAATDVANTNIGWESTRIVDVGFDLSVLKNKFSLALDYYNKRTSDILYTITASAVLGVTPSVENAGVVSNKGFDLNIQHQNTINDFSYNIKANFSFVKNEVKELANVTQDISSGLFVGHPLSSYYGYIIDGLFVDQEDIDNYATQPSTVKPGDIKLKDISGPDGVPDGEVNADYDRAIIGSSFPKYNFGIILSCQYKGFDFMSQFQGVADIERKLGNYESNAFINGSNPQQWMIKGRWTEDNPNPNAAYPRLQVLGGSEPQMLTSTFTVKNANYLRINNLQIGYSIPKKLIAKYGVSRLRFYVGVKNLYTFDHFYQGWDPEMTTDYPPVSYFNMGINVVFK